MRKFSKGALDLIQSYRMDSLSHSKEVVEGIKELTKMLNLNKTSSHIEGTVTWNNINWGDNAPYWNQYYKIIKEYTYPFEVIISYNMLYLNHICRKKCILNVLKTGD